MGVPYSNSFHGSGGHAYLEEALNHYVDGELPLDRQAALFAHLASCEHCRLLLDSIINFRRAGRQEYIAVPTAVDDAFFKRLAHRKISGERIDREAERRPLWLVRGPVSVRSAVAAAVVLFVLGLLVPVYAPPPFPVRSVEATEERVEFPDRVQSSSEMVYVIYPGVTVEAKRTERLSREDAL